MYIDIFLIVVFLWAIYNGWVNGLIRELLSMMGVLVGLFVAAFCYKYLSEYIAVFTRSDVNTVTNLVAFLLLWIVVPIFLGYLATLLTTFLKIIHLGWLNKTLGLVVSLAKFVMLVSCVFSAMEALDILDQSRTTGSHLYAPVKGVIGFFF